MGATPCHLMQPLLQHSQCCTAGHLVACYTMLQNMARGGRSQHQFDKLNK